MGLGEAVEEAELVHQLAELVGEAALARLIFLVPEAEQTLET